MLSIRCQFPEEKSLFRTRYSCKSCRIKESCYTCLLCNISTSAKSSIQTDRSKSNVIAVKLASDKAPRSFKKDNSHPCKATNCGSYTVGFFQKKDFLENYLTSFFKLNFVQPFQVTLKRNVESIHILKCLRKKKNPSSKST